MAQAIDEAGNIWEVDAQGNPVRFVGQAGAQAPQPMTLGRPSPKAAYEGPLAAAQLAKAQQDAANQAAQTQLDREKFEFEKSKKGSPGINPEAVAAAKNKIEALKALKAQVARVRSIFDQDFSKGGIQGVREMLPAALSNANSRFDAAVNGLAPLARAAFRSPGQGSDSDRDVAIFMGMLPSRFSRDAGNLQAFDQMNAMIDDTINGQHNVLGDPPADPKLGLATGSQKFTPDEPASRLATELVRAGMSDEQVNAAMRAGGFAELQPASIRSVRQYLKQNPGFEGTIPGVGRFEGTSLLNRAASSPFGTFLGNVGVSGLAGLPVALAGQEGKQAFDAANATNPTASLLGSAVGGTTATIGAGKVLAPFKLGQIAAANPRAAALLGDTLYGAAYGGATADEGNRGVGALGGAAGGVVGNRLGAGAAKLAGGTLRGVVNPAVDYLRAQGVPLTGGQMLGGFTKRLEDTLAGYSFAGAPLRNRLTEGLEALNRAGYRIAGEPIGHVEQGVGRAGRDGLDAAKGVAYDTALGSMNLNLDPPYIADRAVADASGAALPDVLRPTFDATMRKADSFVQHGGAVPGRSAQAIKRTIREEMRANKGKPGGQFLNDALGEADSAFMDMAARQAPAETALYRAADLTHGRSKVLGKAVDAASGKPGDPGIWTGAQLASALKGANVTQDARRALGPLAENAVRILPSQVPDSGTAGRLALGALAAGSPLAAAGYVTDGADGAQTGGALGIGTILTLAALNTKAGRTAAEKMLLDRPDIMRRIGAGVTRRAGIFGGAGMGVGANIGGLLAN